jgi:hypothetical protein
MTPDLVVAIAGVIVIPILGGAAVALWKLATKLSSLETLVSREMNHNGGSSVKDYARAAKDEAVAARAEAQKAKHQAENVDGKVDQLARAQQDTDRRVRQVSDVVVGMQAVQTFREATAAGPPGSTTSTHTTTTTSTEGTNT